MDNDAEDTPPPVALRVATRSTTDGGEEVKTAFKEGTTLGTVCAGVHYAYTYGAGGVLSAAGDKIFLEHGVSNISVEAFYPYRENGTYTPLTIEQNQNGTTTNSNGEAESNYYLSDALHAIGSTTRADNNLQLTFHHAMSKLYFNVRQYSSATLSLLTIESQPLSASFSFKATYGTVDEVSNISPNRKTVTAYTTDNQTWRAAIIPQNNAALTVKVVADGKTYRAQLDATDFLPGKQYTYGITVNNGLTVTSTSITGWNDDSNGQTIESSIAPGSGTKEGPYQVASFDGFKK